MHPFAVEGEAYVRATRLEANRGYWFHVQEEMAYALLPREHVSESMPGKEWSLVGAASDRPAWLEQVMRLFFRWDEKNGFVPAAMPAEGQGYWVKNKE